MSESTSQRVGEFTLTDEDWVALGYRFPSGYIVMEWVDIPDDAEKVNHQSIYHSMEDVSTAMPEATVEWSEYL